MRFKYGDKVIVNRPDIKSYRQIGTIQKVDLNGNYQVFFENWCGKGIAVRMLSEMSLDHAPDSVTLMDWSENKMLSGNYRIAIVNFVQGTNTKKEYAFACFDDGLNIGDLVLCDTSHGYGVARIVDFRLKDFWSSAPVTKEIICKVDFSAFEKRKEMRKERDALKKKMDQMVAENQELILYQAIAEKNPAMAAMLQDYQRLGGC